MQALSDLPPAAATQVGSCDVKFPIRLEGLAYKQARHAKQVAPRQRRAMSRLCGRSHLPSHPLNRPVGCAPRRHSHYSSYEPELFPGLIYRMVQPKIVLLIFVSGKVVLTGGKVRKEIYAAFENIYPVLQEFRKSSADAQPAAA